MLPSALRATSTKIPRPRNWKTSPFDAPQPLVTPQADAVPPLRLSRGPSATPRRPPPRVSTPQEHVRHRLSLRKAYPEGWSPPRKLSRDAMDGLRILHQHSPETFTTPVLAERFKISPEAVRRILKSKWVPSKERKEELRMREEAKKAERRKNWVRKEWDEGVDKGMLKYKSRVDEREGELELT